MVLCCAGCGMEVGSEQDEEAAVARPLCGPGNRDGARQAYRATAGDGSSVILAKEGSSKDARRH